MDNLPLKYNFKEEEMLIHQDYIDYFDIVKYLIENNMDYNKLNTEHIEKLYQLYENDRSRAAAFAIIVLSKIDTKFVYREPVYLSRELKMSKPERKANKSENNLLKAFPNPATGYFIVEYNITDAVKGASLEVVDMMNRKLESVAITTANGQSMIKASAYAKGIYHCYLINNGKIVSQTKITVE